jgi:hypothetical protein
LSILREKAFVVSLAMVSKEEDEEYLSKKMKKKVSEQMGPIEETI